MSSFSNLISRQTFHFCKKYYRSIFIYFFLHIKCFCLNDFFVGAFVAEKKGKNQNDVISAPNNKNIIISELISREFFFSQKYY